MVDININGVGFNADAVLKMGKEKFVNHRMHNNHWPHLGTKKRQAIEEAWDIIYKACGCQFNIDDYGNTNTAGGQVQPIKTKPSSIEGRKRRADKGGISKS